MSRDVFIADLHLRPEAPEGFRALERLLDALAPGETLWILGDLFEMWAGRGHAALPDYRPALKALRKAADRKVEIRFLGGNRDFLLDDETLAESGMERLAAREAVVECQGRRIYLAHGDFLCPNDKAYLRAAACLRNPLSLALIRALPFAIAHRLALGYRQRSEAKRGKPAAAGTYDLSEDLMARTAARTGAGDLVIGHVHKPVDRPVAGSSAVLHVLDPWEGPAAPYLALENGAFRRGTV